jgi:hypothetical protein
MRKPKKAVQKLVPFKPILAIAARSRTNSELPDHIIILCCCAICGRPITDFDRAEFFTRDGRNCKLRRIGTIGEDRHPLLLDLAKLYAGHVECCERSKANGSIYMFFRKKLSSVLKADQRDQRDLALEGLS